MLAVKTLRSNLNIFRRLMWLMGNQFEISLVANDPVWAEAKIADAINEINRVDKLLSALGETPECFLNSLMKCGWSKKFSCGKSLPSLMC